MSRADMELLYLKLMKSSSQRNDLSMKDAVHLTWVIVFDEEVYSIVPNKGETITLLPSKNSITNQNVVIATQSARLLTFTASLNARTSLLRTLHGISKKTGLLVCYQSLSKLKVSCKH
jgi:hypothetical protein